MKPLYLYLLKRTTLLLLVLYLLLADWLIYSESRFFFEFNSVFLAIHNTPLQLSTERPASISGKDYVMNFEQDRHISVTLAYGSRPVFQRDSWLWLAIKGLVLLQLLLWVGILWQIKRVVDTVGTEQVFTQTNVARIRWIGFGIILLKLLSFLPWWLTRSYVLNQLTEHHISYYETFPFINDIAGSGFTALLIVGLAEVFRSGLYIKQEQDLTI